MAAIIQVTVRIGPAPELERPIVASLGFHPLKEVG
jgi:hypothetical protein